MTRIALAWNRWKRSTAIEELVTMQARSDVGPVYLCGLIAHVSEIEWRIAELEGKK